MRCIRRSLCAGLLAAFILAAFSGCGNIRSAAESDIIQPFASFLDIPGVTEAEIEAIEALRKKGTPFVYGMNPGIEAYERDGELHGFAVSFCSLMDELFGLGFRIKLCEWSELMRGLDTGEVDFTGDMAISEQRRQNGYRMTDPIAERALRYTQHISGRPLAEIAKERKLNFVFVATAATVTDVTSLSYYDFNTIYADTHHDAYRMLAKGTADAFFDKGAAAADFPVNRDLVVQSFFPIINVPIGLTTKNPELEPVISVVQKALTNRDFRRYLKKLYDDGETEFAKHTLLVRLTGEEREYIRDNPVIPFAAEYYNYPTSFYDRYLGEWNGIFFDVLAEVERLTGLRFTLINGSDTEWSELFGLLETGEASLISELLPTEERQGRFLWADQPLVTDYYTLISKSDAPNVSLKDVMNARVGVRANTAYEELFRLWFPNHRNITVYQNPNDVYEAVANGEIDLAMSSQRQLLSLTNYMELSGYKSSILFAEHSESTIGFHIAQNELQSIFNKVLGHIDIEAIAAQWMQRTYDYQKKIAQEQLPWLTAAILLLVCVIALLAVLFRRRHKEGVRLEELVALRTNELEQQNVTIKETSSKLELAVISAQEASRAKGNFLSNMSHEIRTPLHAIIGMTRIGKMSPDPGRKDYAFGRIDDASNHLLGVINDILDISKIEAGKFELSLVPFDVEGMLSKAVSVLSFRIEEKRQRFTLRIDERIPQFLTGDDQRLTQVITNLLSNAVKFTPEGKRILLDAALADETENTCTLRFSVTDEGIGISAEQQERIFSSFEQADNNMTRKYGGTGLGLSITKHIVERMGGGVSLTSELGEGSTFSFTVPLERTREIRRTVETPGNPEAVPDFSGRRLLLADDTDLNREILASLLEPTKLDVDFAANGAEAVRMVGEAPDRYDLIIMDIQMPVMDGLQATRAIRSMEALRAASVPVIALTASVFKEDVDACLQAGMNGHLGKPVNYDALLEMLKRYL